MDLNLTGKKALVLGASSGIGKAIALALASEGVQVAVCSRDEAKLSATAKEIGAQRTYRCDLTVAGAGRAVTEQALQDMGGVDILVTNTGGPKRGHFLEISDEQWHQDFQSIWMSVVETMQVVLPQMQKNQYGRILLVTSYAAVQARPALTTSNGLRAGLLGLASSVAKEYAASGITVNTLMPGLTNTDRLKDINMSPEKIKAQVPAGRLGQPQELASLAAYLASPHAAYVTGQAIAVDGGATL